MKNHWKWSSFLIVFAQLAVDDFVVVFEILRVSLTSDWAAPMSWGHHRLVTLSSRGILSLSNKNISYYLNPFEQMFCRMVTNRQADCLQAQGGITCQHSTKTYPKLDHWQFMDDHIWRLSFSTSTTYSSIQGLSDERPNTICAPLRQWLNLPDPLQIFA